VRRNAALRRNAATTLGSTPVTGDSAPVAGDSAPVANDLVDDSPSPAVRSVQLFEKIARARALQQRLPDESREAQLLAIAMLRRDEALLDELLRRVERSGLFSGGAHSSGTRASTRTKVSSG
jgi:hypothetical protein